MPLASRARDRGALRSRRRYGRRAVVELVAVDEDGKAFLVALGRAVLSAAALESFVLLAVIGRRHAEGWSGEDVNALIDSLGTRPAGARIKALEAAGESPALIARLRSAIKLRNQVVHHLLADPVVIGAVMNGETPPLVAQLDEVSLVCVRLVEEIAPDAFQAATAAVGVGGPDELALFVHGATLPATLSQAERELLEAFQGMPVAVVREALRDVLPGAGGLDRSAANAALVAECAEAAAGLRWVSDAKLAAAEASAATLGLGDHLLDALDRADDPAAIAGRFAALLNDYASLRGEHDRLSIRARDASDDAAIASELVDIAERYAGVIQRAGELRAEVDRVA